MKMKHLKIYEDYFGNEEYEDKKDSDFFHELWLLLKDEEDWIYDKNEYDRKTCMLFSKGIKLEYDSGKNGKKIYDKTFKIIKYVEYPKNITDKPVSDSYEATYANKKLNVSQKKIKEVFDVLYSEHIKRDKEKDILWKEKEEEQREDAIKQLLNRTLNKYNL